MFCLAHVQDPGGCSSGDQHCSFVSSTLRLRIHLDTITEGDDRKLTIFSSLLALLLVLQLVLLIVGVRLFQRRFGIASQVEALQQLADQSEALRQNLSAQLASATADTAMRLEQTKGALGLQVADRLGEGLLAVRSAVESQMKAGRDS